MVTTGMIINPAPFGVGVVCLLLLAGKSKFVYLLKKKIDFLITYIEKKYKKIV